MTGGSGHGGLSLIELLVGLALAAVLATAAAPALLEWSARRRLWEEATALAVEIQALRAAAAVDGRHRGIVFEDAPGATWQAVRDGDGDGILTADLGAGVDTSLGPRRPLAGGDRHVGWMLPSSVLPAPGGTRPLRALPFAPAGILSLSPDGTSSTGTVYLCGRSDCAAVRIYGPGGRLSVWELRGDRWRQRW